MAYKNKYSDYERKALKKVPFLYNEMSIRNDGTVTL